MYAVTGQVYKESPRYCLHVLSQPTVDGGSFVDKNTLAMTSQSVILIAKIKISELHVIRHTYVDAKHAVTRRL